jgi:hypothetical protein
VLSRDALPEDVLLDHVEQAHVEQAAGADELATELAVRRPRKRAEDELRE